MTADLHVIKASGRPPEQFSPDKLERVVFRLFRGRATREAEVASVVQRVQAQLIGTGRSSVKSSEIATLLLRELEDLDDSAYARFAANYDLAALGVALEDLEVPRQLAMFQEEAPPEEERIFTLDFRSKEG